MRLKLRRSALPLLTLCALCGCAAMGGSSGSKAPPPSEPDHKPESGPITPLLDLMSALPKGDPARQAELFQSAKESASLSPTTSNRLQIRPRPGHTRSQRLRSRRRAATVVGTARQA